jgi:methylase of polypeptide subunit release factors
VTYLNMIFKILYRNYEDVIALDGGVEGLDLIRKMILESILLVKEGGFVILEIAEYHKELLDPLI